MSNAPNTPITRHEAIAFAAVGKILRIDIELADNNGRNSFPDGRWSAQDQVGLIEVTGLPDKEFMRSWAEKNKDGELFVECGSTPLDFGKLHRTLQELLAREWAIENVRKLTAQEADVRHLYLHAYSTGNRDILSRLSDTFQGGTQEPVGMLELPTDIDSVWFEGRSFRSPDRSGEFVLNLARFDVANGWSTHQVALKETELPPASVLPGL